MIPFDTLSLILSSSISLVDKESFSSLFLASSSSEYKICFLILLFIVFSVNDKFSDEDLKKENHRAIEYYYFIKIKLSDN